MKLFEVLDHPTECRYILTSMFKRIEALELSFMQYQFNCGTNLKIVDHIGIAVEMWPGYPYFVT